MDVKASLPDSLKATTTNIEVCQHCGRRCCMKILYQHPDLEFEASERQMISPIMGYVYELLECPGCGKLTLRRFHFIDMYEESINHDYDFEIIYPENPSTLKGLPTQIDNGYKAARKVKNIDANAYGVLVGRVLEMICVDRKAEGRRLVDKIDNLVSRGEVPEPLAGVAHGIRGMRNIGAHAEAGDLSPSEVPTLEGLLSALLEYLYVAPALVADAEAKLKRLQKPTARVAKKKAPPKP